MLENTEHLNDPVESCMKRDVLGFDQDLTVDQLLKQLREIVTEQRILYFYVTDAAGKLVGVIPTRTLLTSEPRARLREILVKRMITIRSAAPLYDACELFIMHRLLALPVLDSEGRLVGVVDIDIFTDEMLDVARREDVEDIFQWVGIRLALLRNANPLKSFRYRFPWLTATMVGGIGCAIIANCFEATLKSAIVLGMFLPLTLGIAESVAIQSVTLALQALHTRRRPEAVHRLLWRELLTSMLLGGALGAVIAGISHIWRRQLSISLIIGGSIGASVVLAAMLGTLVPLVLHHFGKDTKVAVGPLTLALTDATACLLYFGIASAVL